MSARVVLSGPVSVPRFSDHALVVREAEAARQAHNAKAFALYEAGGSREDYLAAVDAGWTVFHVTCKASKASRIVGVQS
mgnify:CR=1 FL=1